ncbi:MAG TPA: DNA repair protein RecN, partial [Acidimicrobiia bacterium]|nr:DNA repair protein RecN [Acidimicrobiia bacterium]
LGIIADLLLPLAEGMTVITGETGAGKTLIVDALDLLCGGRADPSSVRDGADEARVEGRFVDGDDEVVLARVIPVRGRSRGYINGHLATVAELATRGRTLVDLHGQHAHQSLLVPAEQRLFLDRYAGPSAVSARADLAAARAHRRQAEAEQDAIGGDDRSRARQLDLARYEVGEIDAAGINDPDEETALAAEEDILADAEAHRAALEVAHERLDGPVQDALGAAIAAVTSRAPFATLADRLRSLQIDAAEVGHDVRVAAEQIVADPQRLADVQQRRARLRELVRKYGPTLADVHAYAQNARDRIAELESHDERAAALARTIAEADRNVAAAAKTLSAARVAAAGPLASAVERHLRQLAMPAATFEVAVEAGDFVTAGDDGADEVTFVLAPNPGEPARPLARAASGGELARAMLALRVVLSVAPPTLVFDEVDAGIGGEAGTAVGQALATLGGRHQVLCVTHLPQVAAFADAHIAVSKAEIGGRTVATAELVLDDARVGEVSRMLAGVGESSHARRHAQELLTRAHDVRTASRATLAGHGPPIRTKR